MSKTIVINIFGEPGSGKSTLASGLFYEMKKKNYDVELVSEYAKELVWEQRNETFKNEIYLFAKQHQRMFRLKDKVKYIITDRPLLMSKVFNDISNKPIPELNALVEKEFNEYQNLNILITRADFDFIEKGRNESEDFVNIIRDKIIDLNLYNFLTGHYLPVKHKNIIQNGEEIPFNLYVFNKIEEYNRQFVK